MRLIVGLASVVLALGGASDASAGGDLLVRGARIVEASTAAPSAPTGIVIRDGRIAAIGTGLEAPGLPVLDVDGSPVIPGLIDAHVHAGIVPGEGQRLDPPEVLRDMRRQQLRAFLAAGVTTVLDCGIAPSTGKEIRDWLAAGGAGPRYLQLAPGFTAPGGYLSDALPPVSSPGEVVERFAALDVANPTGVKVFLESGFGPRSDWPVLTAELRAAIRAEAARRRLPVYAHANKEADKLLALEMGARAIVHTGFYDAAPSEAFVAKMAASGAFLMTTFAVLDGQLTAFEPERLDDDLVQLTTPAPVLATARDPSSGVVLGDAQLAMVTPWLPRLLYPAVRPLALSARATRGRVESAQRAARHFADAGVPIVLGSDSGNWPIDPYQFHGSSTLREAALMSEAGFTPREVLAAATVTPARLLGLENEIGAIRVGSRADMVVLRADPLQSTAALRGARWVIRDGVVRTPAEWMTASRLARSGEASAP